MTNRSKTTRQIGPSTPSPQAAERDAAIAALRRHTYGRTVALGQWNAHRATCTKCAATTPDSHPWEFCAPGRAIAARLARHRAQLARLRAQLAPAGDHQPALFG